MRRSPALLSLALAGALLLSGCGGDDPKSAKAAPTKALGKAGSTQTSGDCTWTANGRPPSADATFPGADAKATATRATMETNHGTIAFTLATEATPCTVLNLQSLAAAKFFDDTICHRLTTDGSLSVLQCGDPSGQGTGGPGYGIPDELGTAEALGDSEMADGVKTYPAGTVAMANSGAPDSGGSQFFLVHEDSILPPSYTVFGQMDDASLEVVRTIAEAGYSTDATGNTPPNERVDVTSLRTS